MHKRFGHSRTPSSQSMIQAAAKTPPLGPEHRHAILKLRIGTAIVILLETLTILAILLRVGLGK